MMNAKDIIAICIATFKRPELLSNCIRSIQQLVIPDNYTVVVIVVDNDEEKSAENHFYEAIKDSTLTAFYYVEPDRGICSARNCLLEKALLHEASYIAFVDDDELTHKQWLVNILKGVEVYKSDIVSAPVIPTRETVAPTLYSKDPKHRSGSIPRNIPAGNVLFSKYLIDELGLRFDRYFDFIGCEDFDFFDRAIKQNMKPVWIDDAIIFETIPPERTTLKYIIYRHFTGGINVVMRYRRHQPLVYAWFRYLPKAIGKFIGAGISLIMAVFTSHSKNFEKVIIKLSNGAGYLCGLMNIVVERYRY